MPPPGTAVLGLRGQAAGTYIHMHFSSSRHIYTYYLIIILNNYIHTTTTTYILLNNNNNNT
jgi:hypothetical protein